MENCANLGDSHSSARKAMVACSGCAGDYEDPDRSAWTADDSEVTDDEAGSERESHDAP